MYLYLFVLYVFVLMYGPQTTVLSLQLAAMLRVSYLLRILGFTIDENFNSAPWTALALEMMLVNIMDEMTGN